MELPLVNMSTCELRSIIRFFTAKNETEVNIHRNLVSVYGEGCMSIQMVRRWRSWFLEGWQNVHDDERSGRPVTATDNAAVAAVRNVVMVWKKPEESAPKKVKVTISAGKVMAIVFWDCKGVLLADYLPPNTTVNAARYCEVLTKLRAAIKRKRPGLLSQKVLLVHDNACPHAARTTQTLLENFKWEIFTHPPYSPELAPSDFHLFPALKLHLEGKHFANDDEVQAEANHWLRRQDTAWYNSGIKKLLQRYQKCLDRNGDYVEKVRDRLVRTDSLVVAVKQQGVLKKTVGEGQVDSSCWPEGGRCPEADQAGLTTALWKWTPEQVSRIVFKNRECPLLTPILTGLSVYLGIMRCLREAVRLKRPERWQNNDWILHVGNARPHTVHVVLQFLAKHSTIQIPHPPYSPDLAPNDFFLYPKLKINLKGRKFDNVDMIQAESKATLRNLSKGDFISCFDNWKKRWNGCIEAGGAYFEKY
ncbi:hypothetical protein LAZ67_X003375 [Cordylochernes scorpioides]|uniref:Mos1 transposase HTH domain-containing protein n=1 Tax=Cordylochernes scorpioides TaxID=51811 RepID=A0ABY6LYZ3_9ARAC|nr:hypothetical protein LAZ67_X003375 [Cordylochernes scorpioides]